MLLDFWWSLALGLKTSGQSKAFWYYPAEKRQTSVEEILSFLDGGCAPQCSLFERVFFFFTGLHPRKYLCFISCFHWAEIKQHCCI